MLRSLADAADINLCVDVGADALVRADGTRVLQVFSNLVGNALKFTPPGGVVTVGAAPEAGAVRFWVRDTGPGIPPEDVDRLWDPFWQAEGPARSGGAGLGLAITRGLVEAHGGRVWVESQPGAGTTFGFTLGVEPPPVKPS